MRWVLGTVSVLILGLVLQLGYLVYAMYVLLSILLISRFLTQQWTEGLTTQRWPVPQKAEVGGKQKMTVTITNESGFALPWLLFEESLPRAAMAVTPPRITIKGKAIGINRLANGESHFLEYTVGFHQRGYYQFGPLLVETGDLFGLHRRFQTVTEPEFVLVPPKVVPLQGYQITSRRPVGEIRIAHRLFEDPTRIAAVRPYQPGDPLNQIHWRATARTGELHSRIYENSCVAGATFLLDFHAQAYEGAGAAVSSELAITTVASLANALYEEGHQFGFISNGRDAAERIKFEGWSGEFTTRTEANQRVQPAPEEEVLRPITIPTRKGADQLTRILESLARLEPNPGLRFAQLIEETAAFLPRDASVVPILRDVSEETALALGLLRHRGFAVTVILIQFDEGHNPSWAQAPEWAEALIAQGLDYLTVPNEAGLAELSTLAFTR